MSWGHINAKFHSPGNLPSAEWMERGQCRIEGHDPNVFVPGGCRPRIAPFVLQVCERCEVRRQCLDYALSFRNMDGVWGGTTPQDRAKMSA